MLLWVKVQQNMSIFGMNALAQRNFQTPGLGAAEGTAWMLLYPSEAE